MTDDHLSGHQGSHFRSFLTGALLFDTVAQLRAGTVGEHHQRGGDMLVQVRRLGEGRQRLPLAACRRQQDHFAIASFHFSGEDGGDGAARGGLGENQIAVGKVKVNVVFPKAEVADAIALPGIERGVMNRAGHFGSGRSGSAGGGRGADQDRNKRSMHLFL